MNNLIFLTTPPTSYAAAKQLDANDAIDIIPHMDNTHYATRFSRESFGRVDSGTYLNCGGGQATGDH
jgi:hypothetical protein